MGQYRIEFRPSVRKDLKKVARPDVPRTLASIDKLGDDPFPPGSKKLTGAELYRIRIGTYRVIYEVSEKKLVVLIVEAGHRSDVYE